MAGNKIHSSRICKKKSKKTRHVRKVKKSINHQLTYDSNDIPKFLLTKNEIKQEIIEEEEKLEQSQIQMPIPFIKFIMKDEPEESEVDDENHEIQIGEPYLMSRLPLQYYNPSPYPITNVTLGPEDMIDFSGITLQDLIPPPQQDFFTSIEPACNGTIQDILEHVIRASDFTSMTMPGDFPEEGNIIQFSQFFTTLDM